MTFGDKQKLILGYLKAYNSLDVEGMLRFLEEDIEFENYQGGELTHQLEGKANFEKQANEALAYFSSRNQRAVNWTEKGESLEVEIEFQAIAAVDFPNGLKKGQFIQFEGKSIFEFGDSRILKIKDFS
ncbi:MAG: nuclear transport factor 2 family protein [Bacteroidota bacterium]